MNTNKTGSRAAAASYENEEELFLFAMNDGATYEKSLSPIMDNMDRKRRAGKFDAEKAVKGFLYGAEFAARRYCQAFGGVWYQVFNPATRRAAAALFLDRYLADTL